MKVNATKAKLYVPKFHELIAGNVQKPIVLLSGGRGSAKSTSAAQTLARAAIKGKYKRQAIIRKYFKYIRESQYADIKTFCERLQVDSVVNMGVSPLGFQFPGGSSIISLGLDKAKVKSLSGMDLVWVEEATELTYEDYLNLVLTVLRGQGNKQIILTYNPIYNHWLNDEFFYADGTPKRKDTYYLHTTYKDNPFVGDIFRQQIESLPEDLYNLHGLGLPGKLEGLIYEYSVISEFPDLPYAYGVDKGFNDAFAVVKAAHTDAQLYWHEVAYERFKTPTKMIAFLKAELPASELSKDWFFDDSAADTIQEFRDAGFNAKKANKGKIIDGITTVKSCELHITAESVNLQREAGGYVWRKDGKGNALDEPAVGLSDHALDAGRYATINIIAAPVVVSAPRVIGRARTPNR